MLSEWIQRSEEVNISKKVRRREGGRGGDRKSRDASSPAKASSEKQILIARTRIEKCGKKMICGRIGTCSLGRPFWMQSPAFCKRGSSRHAFWCEVGFLNFANGFAGKALARTRLADWSPPGIFADDWMMGSSSASSCCHVTRPRPTFLPFSPSTTIKEDEGRLTGARRQVRMTSPCSRCVRSLLAFSFADVLASPEVART